MKISTIPTKRILVKANCQSEWDCCNFALITCDDYWKKEFKKKMDAIAPFNAPEGFLSFRFLDYSVEFYQSKEDEAEILPEGKDWAFISLEEGEEDSFSKPENQLDPGVMILYKDGSGFYQTHGKYSGEEFYTNVIPFQEVFEGII